MRAVAREAAFEKREGVDLEGFRKQAALPLEEIRNLARAAAFPAGEGDVRVEGAVLRLQADSQARALHLGCERGDGFLGLDAGPQRPGIALLEAADAAHADREAP